MSDIQLLWGMHDKAFATKRFKRNAAQQAVKSNIVTTFRFLEAKYSLQCSKKRAEKTIKQHVMPFLPPLTHATKFWQLPWRSIRLASLSCCRAE